MGAVIYCRVSTKEQLDNLSLPTQDKACREYCRRNGWDVLKVFHERGESAKTADRTELTNLIEYCRKNKGKVHTVVVYALNRFARQNYDHHALRALLAKSRVTLRSVTEPIDDSPTGKLMEGVLSSFAEFDNNVRAARTTEGMKAALAEGTWPWQAPLGYLQPGMRHDSAVAPLVASARRLSWPPPALGATSSCGS